MFGRTGGAPTFAMGIAHMFAQAVGSRASLSIWYHFCHHVRMLFILTTVDAMTRAGRYLLQDISASLEALGRTESYPA